MPKENRDAKDLNFHDRESDNAKSNGMKTPEQCSRSSKPPLPVDRGWAWFVMIGALINIACVITFLRSSSLLFIEFLEKYQVSATLTTLAFSLLAVTFAISSMLQPVLFLPRFTVRTLALTGSIINFVAIIIIAISPNIVITNIFFMVVGFAHGFVMVPQMALIGCYFKKRLSLAASTANLGLSIATIGGPPLTQYLLDTYGLQGAVLLLAALNLHCMVGSMLMRPVSFYDQTQLSEENSEEPDENGCVKESTTKATSSDILTLAHSDIIYDVDSPSPRRLQPPGQNGGGDYTRIRSFSVNEPSLLNDYKVTVEEIPGRQGHWGASSRTLNTSTLAVHEDFLDKLSRTSSTRYLSSSSFALTLMAQHPSKMATSTRSLAPPGPSQDEILLSIKTKGLSDVIKRKERSPICCPCLKRSNNDSSPSVYTNPFFILLVLASGLGVHAQAYYAYTPVLGKENGLTIDQIPYLLTIAGVCDLISKLSVGIVADLPWVRRIYLAGAIQLIFGIALQFVSFFKGFNLMIVMQVIGGAFVQVLMTLLPAITADILGPEFIGHIMSGYFLVNGAICTVDHIIVGLFKDMTNSFVPAFHYMGAYYFLSFFLLALEPLISRRSRRK